MDLVNLVHAGLKTLKKVRIPIKSLLDLPKGSFKYVYIILCIMMSHGLKFTNLQIYRLITINKIL